MDWRPIETAPRDGTEILVWNSYRGVYQSAYTTRWTGEPDEYEKSTYDGFPCGFWMGSPNSYPFGKWDPVPSHWQPLPEPPQ